MRCKRSCPFAWCNDPHTEDGFVRFPAGPKNIEERRLLLNGLGRGDDGFVEEKMANINADVRAGRRHFVLGADGAVVKPLAFHVRNKDPVFCAAIKRISEDDETVWTVVHRNIMEGLDFGRLVEEYRLGQKREARVESRDCVREGAEAKMQQEEAKRREEAEKLRRAEIVPMQRGELEVLSAKHAADIEALQKRFREQEAQHLREMEAAQRECDALRARIATVEEEYRRLRALFDEAVARGEECCRERDAKAALEMRRLKAKVAQLLKAGEEQRLKHAARVQELLEKLDGRGMKLSIDWMLQQDDKTVRAYTALPLDGLVALLGLCDAANIQEQLCGRRTLRWKECVLLTLVMLKINCGMVVLGSLFSVSFSTASRVFNLTLELLEEILVFCFQGNHDIPEENKLPPFKKDAVFSDVLLIADTTLVAIEKPSNSMVQRHTFSNYIGDHAIKTFVAVGTDTQVCFVSDAYAANATDLEVALECGFLDLITPGARVLFDKGGADMAEAVAKRGGILTTPAFVVQHGLTFTEWERSAMVAGARIGIELAWQRARQAI